MPSTRKMPVRADEQKRKISSEHLVPQLSDSPSGFVSVKTGKSCSRGVVVYLGRDVTPEMMLERYCKVLTLPIGREIALSRLAAYCEALQTVKIGNLVSVGFSPDGLPILQVEQEHFLTQKPVQLP
jgi:hypothetical protein